MRNIFLTTLEFITFITLISVIILNLLMNDNMIISFYESLAGHTIDKISVWTILLFKDILCVGLIIIIFVGIYFKCQKQFSIFKKENITSKKFIIALLLPLMVFLLIQLFYTKQFVDDAFISFRYAQNLFETRQLTFNVDEAPVEGYTHPLWIFLLLLPQYLRIDLLLYVKLIGLLFGILGLFIIYQLSEKNAVATWMYALSVSVASWTVTGLETPMYTALALLFIYLFLKERYILSSLTLFLVTMTRPEGVILLIPAIYVLIKYSKKFSLINFTKLILPFLILYLLHNLWRYIYFGSLFPNTFYAKSIFLGGLSRINYFVLYISPLIIASLIYLFYMQFAEKNSKMNSEYFFSKKKNIFLILCFLLTLLSYLNIAPLMAAYDRFYQLALVLIYVISSKPIYIGINKLMLFSQKNNTQFFAICLICLFFLPNSINLPESVAYFHIHYDGLQKAHMNVSQILNQQYYGRNYTVALSDLGVFSYYSKFKIIDIQGLADKVLSKGFNLTYILGKNPEIIILVSSSKSEFVQHPEVNAMNGEDLIIYNDIDFQKRYIFTNMTFEHTPPVVLWVFKRKNLS